MYRSCGWQRLCLVGLVGAALVQATWSHTVADEGQTFGAVLQSAVQSVVPAIDEPLMPVEVTQVAPCHCCGVCDGAAPAGVTEPDCAESLWQRSQLTGDWLGLRPALAKEGITFDLFGTQFYQGVAAGGLEQAWEYGGRFDCLPHLNEIGRAHV